LLFGRIHAFFRVKLKNETRNCNEPQILHFRYGRHTGEFHGLLASAQPEYLVSKGVEEDVTALLEEIKTMTVEESAALHCFCSAFSCPARRRT
jgi:hypothetical protein